jgi:hypothetical protein
MCFDRSESLVACGLHSVLVDEMAMHGAIAVLANSRVFSHTGGYRLLREGLVRVWLTESRNLWVIHSALGAVLLSPRQPQAFVDPVSRIGRLDSASAEHR